MVEQIRLTVERDKAASAPGTSPRAASMSRSDKPRTQPEITKAFEGVGAGPPVTEQARAEPLGRIESRAAPDYLGRSCARRRVTSRRVERLADTTAAAHLGWVG